MWCIFRAGGNRRLVRFKTHLCLTVPKIRRAEARGGQGPAIHPSRITGLWPVQARNRSPRPLVGFSKTTHFAAGILFTAICGVATLRYASGATYDVRTYGAKGDGVTFDTQAIQAAVDAATNAGGGTVLFPAQQTFLTGTIFWKSNVTLEVEGTVLGGPDLSEYVQIPPDQVGVQSYAVSQYSQYALFYANGASNITLQGGGTIDGNAKNTSISTSGNETNRPFVLRVIRSTNVNVNHITLRNSIFWMQHYLECDGVTIDNVTVDNRNFYETDGVNIDSSSHVSITNSTLVSFDDALAVKSTSAKPAQHVTVNNVALSSLGGNGFKTGTESEGGFNDLVFENSTVSNVGRSAIAIQTVDGGNLYNVRATNITLGPGVSNAFHIRLGARNRAIPGLPVPTNASMDTVILDGIHGSTTNNQGSWISGTPGQLITDVTIQNSNIVFAGGDTNPADANIVPPENPATYPDWNMFGRMPSYAIFSRHVRGLTLSNNTFSASLADARPQLKFNDVTFGATSGSPDGSTISGGSGSLQSSDGTWSFGAAESAYPGNWDILLNGQTVGIGSKIEVANGGHVYGLGTNNRWFIWQNGSWVATTNPNPSFSPDGSIISGGSGSLQSSDGIWSFGIAESAYPGNWDILLNGQAVGIGSEIEVANGGHVYAVGTDNRWYIWQNGSWVAMTNPNPSP